MKYRIFRTKLHHWYIVENHPRCWDNQRTYTFYFSERPTSDEVKEKIQEDQRSQIEWLQDDIKDIEEKIENLKELLNQNEYEEVVECQ